MSILNFEEPAQKNQGRNCFLTSQRKQNFGFQRRNHKGEREVHRKSTNNINREGAEALADEGLRSGCGIRMGLEGRRTARGSGWGRRGGERLGDQDGVGGEENCWGLGPSLGEPVPSPSLQTAAKPRLEAS